MNPGLTSVITSGDKAFNFEERNSSARIRHRLQSKEMSDAKDDLDISSDEDDDRGGKGSGKSRRELPSGAVSTLKAWLLSPEHFTHPYPTPQDQAMLMQKTGIDKKQLKNWFTNARRRIWKPMLKKQLEQGTLTATGSGGNGVAVPGVVPGLMVHVTAPVNAHSHTSQDIDNPHSVQAIQVHYQKAVQQHSQQPQTQQQQYDHFGHVYTTAVPQSMQHTQHQASSQAEYTQQFYTQSQQTYGEQQPQQIVSMAPSRDIGSMSCLHPTTVSVSNNIENPTMNKTDSHAVLMELFARDQDLVRQATESAKMKKATGGAVEQNQVSNQQQLNNGNQQFGKIGSQTKLTAVPTLNSWPHFSSISSLNNLGSMVGVKSITSMSGFDLANQGNLNKMGNLAQVKSMESMGKNDSYAFLEVFFGDRSMSNANLASGKDIQKGIKREREEDNDVGLSLDGDDPPPTPKPQLGLNSNPNITSASPAPLTTMDSLSDSGTLKRAYDDALAARGLMSVSRSSENLSDLALPAKIQRTLSQQYLRQHQAQAAQQQQFLNYNYAQTPATDAVGMTNPSTNQPSGSSSQQYPGQHPQQQQPAQGLSKYLPVVSPAAVMCTNSQDNSGEVKVPFTSICACCQSTGVDTQLRPCGHMFHEHCLKPSLQIPAGQPKCPIDNIPIQSALLAIPTDDQQSTRLQWGSGASVPTYQSPPIPAEPAQFNK